MSPVRQRKIIRKRNLALDTNVVRRPSLRILKLASSISGNGNYFTVGSRRELLLRSRGPSNLNTHLYICWHGSTVEHVICNLGVVGSIPSASSSLP